MIDWYCLIRIIAWPLAVFYSLRTAGQIVCRLAYTKAERLRDAMNGVDRTWPLRYYPLVALVAWAVILALR